MGNVTPGVGKETINERFLFPRTNSVVVKSPKRV